MPRQPSRSAGSTNFRLIKPIPSAGTRNDLAPLAFHKRTSFLRWPGSLLSSQRGGRRSYSMIDDDFGLWRNEVLSNPAELIDPPSYCCPSRGSASEGDINYPSSSLTVASSSLNSATDL